MELSPSYKTILICFLLYKITRVLGANVRVPRRRNILSNQMEDFEYTSRQSLQTTEGDWYRYRREFHNAWKLNESVRDAANDKLLELPDSA